MRVGDARLMLGRGLDEEGLREALTLEDPDRRTFAPHRPSMLACLLLSSVGRTDEASEALSTVRAACAEHGEDAELVYTAIHAVQLSLWRGDVAEARAAAEAGGRTRVAARHDDCTGDRVMGSRGGRRLDRRRAQGAGRRRGVARAL